MSHDVVNESSVFTLRTRFYGTTGPQVPSTARYRIRDVTNDRVVRDWTTMTPALFVDIQVIASDNDVYSDQPGLRYHFEERVLVVEANYDTDIQYADEYRYVIKNLRGFES
jgi:hypothetical protein